MTRSPPCPCSTLMISPLPFEAEQILFKLLWHDRTDKAPPQIWFRSMITDLIRQGFRGRAARG